MEFVKSMCVNLTSALRTHTSFAPARAIFHLISFIGYISMDMVCIAYIARKEFPFNELNEKKKIEYKKKYVNQLKLEICTAERKKML